MSSSSLLPYEYHVLPHKSSSNYDNVILTICNTHKITGVPSDDDRKKMLAEFRNPAGISPNECSDECFDAAVVRVRPYLRRGGTRSKKDRKSVV